MLSEEQIIQIKQQLLQQIESTFPEDKKEIARQQVESMNDEQLEEFLKQNNLVKNQEGASQVKCIFCSIISGKVPSHKIYENENAIAVLEINPISLGHIIIIPKEHISSKEQLSSEIFSFAEEISKKIKEKLNPKNVLIEESNIFGHEILNIIPVYENEDLNSPRKKAQPDELEELQIKLTEKIKEQVEEINKEPEEINEKNTWLPKRIP
jgi:histidine triad (HIT) family protein